MRKNQKRKIFFASREVIVTDKCTNAQVKLCGDPKAGCYYKMCTIRKRRRSTIQYWGLLCPKMQSVMIVGRKDTTNITSRVPTMD